MGVIILLYFFVLPTPNNYSLILDRLPNCASKYPKVLIVDDSAIVLKLAGEFAVIYILERLYKNYVLCRAHT